MLNEDQLQGFNLGVELYTKLLTENKELITGIIEMSYSQGIQEGIRYSQQQVLAQQAERAEQEEVWGPELPKPVPENVKGSNFADKLHGVKR